MKWPGIFSGKTLEMKKEEITLDKIFDYLEKLIQSKNISKEDSGKVAGRIIDFLRDGKETEDEKTIGILSLNSEKEIKAALSFFMNEKDNQAEEFIKLTRKFLKNQELTKKEKKWLSKILKTKFENNEQRNSLREEMKTESLEKVACEQIENCFEKKGRFFILSKEVSLIKKNYEKVFGKASACFMNWLEYSEKYLREEIEELLNEKKVSNWKSFMLFKNELEKEKVKKEIKDFIENSKLLSKIRFKLDLTEDEGTEVNENLKVFRSLIGDQEKYQTELNYLAILIEKKSELSLLELEQVLKLFETFKKL